MSLSAANTLSVAIEQVKDNPQLMVEKSNLLDRLIVDNGRAEKVSAKAARITFETALPGEVALGNLDDDSTAFPDGGQSEYAAGSLNVSTFIFPISWTKLAEIQKSPQMLLDIVPKQITRVTERAKQMRDMVLASGDGAATLGTVTASSSTSITLDASSFGAKLIVKNQTVSVFNGTALRGKVKVLAVANQIGGAQTLTIANGTLPVGTTANDTIKVAGAADGAPIGPNGIINLNSNVASGNLFGVDRTSSLNNWALCNGYDLANATVTPSGLKMPINQIRAALGEEAVKNGEIIVHTSDGQITAYEEIGESLQTIPLTGGMGGDLDLIFRGKKSVDGHPIYRNTHAHNGRWDYLRIKSWGKFQYGKGLFWFDWEGKKVFPKYANNGTSLQITSGASSYLVDAYNYYIDNPKAQASLYNAKPAAGY